MDLKNIANVENISLEEFFYKIENNHLYKELEKSNENNVFRRFLKNYIPIKGGKISDVFSDENIKIVKESLIKFETLNALQNERVVRLNRGEEDVLGVLNSSSFKEVFLRNLQNLNETHINELFGGDFERVVKTYENLSLDEIKEIIKTHPNEKLDTFLNIFKLKFDFLGSSFQDKLNDIKQKHIANIENIKLNLENGFKPFIDDLKKLIESFGGEDYQAELIELQNTITKSIEEYKNVIDEKLDVLEKKLGYSKTLFNILNNELSFEEKLKQIEDLNKTALSELDEFELIEYTKKLNNVKEEKEKLNNLINNFKSVLSKKRKITYPDVSFIVNYIDAFENDNVKEELENLLKYRFEPDVFRASIENFVEKFEKIDYENIYIEELKEFAFTYSNEFAYSEFTDYIDDYIYRKINLSEPFTKIVEKYKDRIIIANQESVEFIHKNIQEAYKKAIELEDSAYIEFYLEAYATYKSQITEKVEQDYFDLYKYVRANREGKNILADVLTHEDFQALEFTKKKEIVKDFFNFLKQEWEKGVSNQTIKNDFIGFYKDLGEYTSLIRELSYEGLVDNEDIEFIEKINKYFDLYADDNTYIRTLYAKNALEEFTYQALRDNKRYNFSKMNYYQFSDYLDKKIIEEKGLGKDIFNVILVEAKNKAIEEFFEKKEQIKEELGRGLNIFIVNREINTRLIENLKRFYKNELAYIVSKNGEESIYTNIDEYIDGVVNSLLKDTSLEQTTPEDLINKFMEKYQNSIMLRKLNETYLKEKLDKDYVLMALKQQAISSYKDINKRFLDIAHKEINNATGRFKNIIETLDETQLANLRDAVANIYRGIPDTYEKELENATKYLATFIPLSEGEIKEHLKAMTQPYLTNKKSLLADVDAVLSGEKEAQAELISDNLKITKKGEIKPPEAEEKEEKNFEERLKKFLSTKSSQFVKEKKGITDILTDNNKGFEKYAIISNEGITFDLSYNTLAKNIDNATKNNKSLFADELIETLSFHGQMVMSMSAILQHTIKSMKEEGQLLQEAIKNNKKLIVKNKYLKDNIQTAIATQRTMTGAMAVALLLANDVKAVINFSRGKQTSLEEIDRKIRRLRSLKGVYSKLRYLHASNDKNPFSILDTIEKHLVNKKQIIQDKVALNKNNMRKIISTLKNFNDISEFVIENSPSDSPHLANVIKEITDEGGFKVFNKKFKKIDKYIENAISLEYSNDVGQREKERLKNLIYREYERNEEIRKKAVFRAYEVVFTSKNPKEQIKIINNIKNSSLLDSEQKQELVNKIKEVLIENINKDTLGSVFILLDEEFINYPKVQEFMNKIDINGHPVEDIDDFASLIESKILKSALESQDNNLNLKDITAIMEEKELKKYNKKEVEEIIGQLRDTLKSAINQIRTYDDLERIMETKLEFLNKKVEKREEKAKSNLKELGKIYGRFSKISPFIFKQFLKHMKEGNIVDKAINDITIERAENYSQFKANMYKLLSIDIDDPITITLEDKLQEVYKKHNGSLRESFKEITGESIEEHYLKNLEKVVNLAEDTIKSYPKIYEQIKQLNLKDGQKTYLILIKKLLEELLYKKEDEVLKNFNEIVQKSIEEVKGFDKTQMEKENVALVSNLLEILGDKDVKNIDEAVDRVAEHLEEAKQKTNKNILGNFKSIVNTIKDDVIKDLLSKETIKTVEKEVLQTPSENIDEKKEINVKYANLIEILSSYELPKKTLNELYAYLEKADLNNSENFETLIEKLENLQIANSKELAFILKEEKDYADKVEFNEFNKKQFEQTLNNNKEILNMNEEVQEVFTKVEDLIEEKSKLTKYKKRIEEDIINVFLNNEEINEAILDRKLERYKLIDPEAVEKIKELLLEYKGLLSLVTSVHKDKLKKFKPLSEVEIKEIMEKEAQKLAKLKEERKIREAREKWQKEQSTTSTLSR